ncbi:hypothetical protein AHP7_09 [Aeromonas phage AHPMCC7]|uniref:Uncharacterized protein n=2 Tax=Viruses TaxID=10239 RepID=A0A9E8K552_9CAUD|nr:hypothetical protein AHP7_09 [Aeromonas phage AHPMCC7]UZV40999.1 hypothetical protein P2_0043 [Aeromonas phage P2]
MSQPDNSVQPVKEVHRLTPAAYDQLEKLIGQPSSGTPEQMSFQLGCQKVLYLLRKGFVVG